MSKTSPNKGNASRQAAPQPRKTVNPMLPIAVVVVVIGAGIAFWRSPSQGPAPTASATASAATPASEAASAPAGAQAGTPAPARDSRVDAAAEEAARAVAAVGPHKQKN